MPLLAIEREVLRLLGRGLSSEQCARALSISTEDVYRHLGAAMRALSVQSKLEAILVAAQRGLIDLPSTCRDGAPSTTG